MEALETEKPLAPGGVPPQAPGRGLRRGCRPARRRQEAYKDPGRPLRGGEALHMILAARRADLFMYNGLDLEAGYLPVLVGRLYVRVY